MTAKIDDKVKTIVRFQWIIAIVLSLIILVPLVAGLYLNRNFNQVYQVSISGEVVLSATELCPGDRLRYRYVVTTGGEGRLDKDRTLWRVKPPRTLISSQIERIIIPGPTEQEILEIYEIPETYYDVGVARELPIPSGEYIRLISIGSPSRSTVFASTDKIKFSVRERCPS